MQVWIKYQVHGEHDARVLTMTPQEYFDPLDEEEHDWTAESTPKHQDAYEYTGRPAKDLRWTILEVLDGKKFWRVRTQFLDGASSMMTHTQDSDGNEEIIHQTEILPGCWQIIRTLKPAGQTWTVVFSHMAPVGSKPLVTVRGYCGQWTFEEMKQFASVQFANQ